MTSNDQDQPAPRVSRERELTSLYATARSLTALGELDDVLDSIVRHAHELIGTDFTYLSLRGPDGDLSLTASEGTISSAFREAHIPRGTGLGGRVLETKSPQWVGNYADADELRHHPGFDALVGNEGMVALLGVPLLVRDEAIGVLFAADRAQRSFGADEIALLSAFADHAAVAMDNARLYDESRTALEQLQVAYRTIEQQVAVMERAQSVHEALTGVVLGGGGPEGVALQLAERMGGTVSILDPVGATLARGSAVGEDNVLAEVAGDSVLSDATMAEAVEQARRTGRCATTGDGTGASHSAATIRAGDSLLGTLIWSRGGEPDLVDIRTIERATHIIGLLMLKENAVADAAERLSGELLTELLVASPSVSTTQRSRARSRGIDIEALGMVVAAECDEVSHGNVARRLHVIAQEQAGLAGEYLGRATMLVPSGDPEALVKEIHRRLRTEIGHPVTVVADVVPGLDWARGFSRASRCLAVARAIGADDVGATTEGLALYAMVFDTERAHELERFIADSIGALVDYDQRRSTELVATLDAYFDNDGNLRQSAAALHVHLNTLHKRLDRIAAVLGRDWRGADDLQLRLAVRMQGLKRRLGHTG